MKTTSSIKKTSKILFLKWAIAIKIIPMVILIAVLKLLAHIYGLEVMELNALFTSLVAGTIFLIGFLISGVLTDYKESEKIPTELTASLKTILDDTYTIYKSKNSEKAKQFLDFQKTLAQSIMDWFYKKERTATILKKLSSMNEYFVEFEKEGIQPAYIIRIKNEQNALRKFIMRIDTIRDTEFIGSAYAIVEAMGFIIGIGLLIMKIEPFYASLFFTLIVTFLITYMLLLIKDLDNPFDYSFKGESGTEISLKPIRDHLKELDE